MEMITGVSWSRTRAAPRPVSLSIHVFANNLDASLAFRVQFWLE